MATAYYDKGLFHGGTHIVDLLQFFLGKALRVQATINPHCRVDRGELAVDAILAFRGLHAVLQISDSRKYAVSEMSFFGEGGRLNVKRMWGLEFEVIGTRACNDFSAYRELDYTHTRTFGENRSFLGPALQHMIACLERKETPINSGDDAIATLKVLLAIQKSARQSGKTIRVG
jgi:predicted dehydrogenase